MNDYQFDTLAIHAGQEPDPTSGAVMQPIVLSSTFAQQSPGKHKGYEYSRSDNPTRKSLEVCIAALESARHGMAFASGCAATASLFHTLRPGDEVISCDDVYGGTFRLFEKVLRPFGITAKWVDLTRIEELEKNFTSATKMVWIETPTNPLLKIIDIKRVTELAHARNIKVGVDNTFATPVLQRPLELGADVVVHSLTKYLNGHSDVVGGVVVTNDDDLGTQIRFVQNAMGAVPSPFDCFLVLRGLKTLHVRVQRHCENALALAQWLEQQPLVEKVIYPGLPSHPQHALAMQQMKQGGGMISLLIRGGSNAARRLLETVRIFTLAESLGGVESLIEHPAIMTHGSIPKEQRDRLGISDGLLRLSVGIEALEDLKADLDHALRAAQIS